MDNVVLLRWNDALVPKQAVGTQLAIAKVQMK